MMKTQHSTRQQKTITKADFFSKNTSVNRFIQLMLMAIFLALVTATHAEPKVPQITVYKSPTCGCCNKWIKHLETNGFKVKAHNKKDMRTIKQKADIKPELQSCHTAFIDGYYIEGHVPAKDIKRLLKEQPKDTAGLTVPGMPMGSPGMEGHRKDPYIVIKVKKDQSKQIYSQN